MGTYPCPFLNISPLSHFYYSFHIKYRIKYLEKPLSLNNYFLKFVHFFMNITENQRKWCLKLMSDLYQWKISFVFRSKVDPEGDDVPDYFDVVKQPMDLDTVKATLLDDKYADVESFLSDLRLICTNAELYFGPEAVMTFMAQEMLQYIDKQAENAHLSPEQIWYKELTEIQEKIERQVAKRIAPPVQVPSPKKKRRR